MTNPKTQPIHTCWETCECEGCEKIRKDKTVNPKIGVSNTRKCSETPPASKCEFCDDKVDNPLCDECVQGIVNYNIDMSEEHFKSEGRQEVLDKVEKWADEKMSVGMLSAYDLKVWLQELKGGSDE